MTWLKPTDEHIVYEALSAIADGRFERLDNNTAKCTSTSKGKFYTVTYDPATQAVMSNDNMAFFQDKISYPMVAMLLVCGEIDYDTKVLASLKDIKWRDINRKNKNDYMKSVREVLSRLEANGVDTSAITKEVSHIYQSVLKLDLEKLGKKVFPPKAY